ncbi:hypothetical protein GCM10017559_01240 [Streptosporangium longisporum]|uniref:Uncharacterized protein n=1 Tax=Streptosporangium longisporum TaxID=46187 RepID=A0ABN3XPP4_9ACTN
MSIPFSRMHRANARGSGDAEGDTEDEAPDEAADEGRTVSATEATPPPVGAWPQPAGARAASTPTSSAARRNVMWMHLRPREVGRLPRVHPVYGGGG